MTSKPCTRCNEVKPLASFSPSKRARDGLHHYCKDCKNAYRRWYARANPERIRDSVLRSKYGITAREYDDLLAEQHYGCAICETSEPGGFSKGFVVDHDHESGSVRGLLCTQCNVGIGMMQDSPMRLRSAADYLEAAP